MVGVGLLAVTVTIMTGMWGITRPVERAVAVIIVAVFPFFFETFSYFTIRHVVPLAIAIAAAGILVRPAVGFPLLVLAACFYQSGVYFAAVVVLIWAGVEALNNRPCVRLLVEKALMVGAALLLWRIGVAIVGWLYPSYAAHLEIFSRPAGSAAELWFSLKLHAAAMLSFFTEGVFLFPLRAKLVAVAGILLLAIGGWRLVRWGEVHARSLCVRADSDCPDAGCGAWRESDPLSSVQIALGAGIFLLLRCFSRHIRVGPARQ